MSRLHQILFALTIILFYSMVAAQDPTNIQWEPIENQ